MPKSKSPKRSLKKSQSKISLASSLSTYSGEGDEDKTGRSTDPRVQRWQQAQEVTYIKYDGPRPDEEFLHAVRIEMQEGAQSLRRAQESVQTVYGLQLTGQGRRLQKAEPVALERLVAVDVNQRSVDGYTSLLVATAAGNADMVSLLLECRADVALSSVHRAELPIHFAAQGGYDVVLRLLVEPTKARGLLNVGTVTGWNALHLAVAGQHQGAMNLLLRSGANINARNDSLGGGTALHVASRMAWTEGMEALLDRDADPNAMDRVQQAPLHGAARRADVRAVSLLLRSRAQVNAPGPENKKALDLVPLDHPNRQKVTLMLQAYLRPAPAQTRSDGNFHVEEKPKTWDVPSQMR